MFVVYNISHCTSERQFLVLVFNSLHKKFTVTETYWHFFVDIEDVNEQTEINTVELEP